MKDKIVKVSWIDSGVVSSGWVQLSEIENYSSNRIETVGYIVNDNDERFLIAQSIGKSHIAGVISIPKIQITKLEFLK
jgi:hypothetical protein